MTPAQKAYNVRAFTVTCPLLAIYVGGVVWGQSFLKSQGVLLPDLAWVLAILVGAGAIVAFTLRKAWGQLKEERT